MSGFPKIDQPCPLGIDEKKRLDGYCTPCEKTVYALDAMSVTERKALLCAAGGPICVSYRVPARSRSVRFGAAMALAMVVLPAAAGDVVPASPAATETKSESQAPPSALSSELRPVQVKCKEGESSNENVDLPLEEIMLTGGVIRPGDAQWVEADDSLPDLPVVVEHASGGR